MNDTHDGFDKLQSGSGAFVFKITTNILKLLKMNVCLSCRKDDVTDDFTDVFKCDVCTW